LISSQQDAHLISKTQYEKLLVSAAIDMAIIMALLCRPTSIVQLKLLYDGKFQYGLTAEDYPVFIAIIYCFRWSKGCGIMCEPYKRQQSCHTSTWCTPVCVCRYLID